MHHKYKQPTAFSVTAVRPVEIVHIQITLFIPRFITPVQFGNNILWNGLFKISAVDSNE